MPVYNNINSVWRNVGVPSVNINGVWRSVMRPAVNIDGTWRYADLSFANSDMEYCAAKIFPTGPNSTVSASGNTLTTTVGSGWAGTTIVFQPNVGIKVNGMSSPCWAIKKPSKGLGHSWGSDAFTLYPTRTWDSAPVVMTLYIGISGGYLSFGTWLDNTVYAGTRTYTMTGPGTFGDKWWDADIRMYINSQSFSCTIRVDSFSLNGQPIPFNWLT